MLNIHNKIIERYPDRPEKIFIGQMLANLFSFLNTNYQLDFINKNDVKNHPKIWKTLNLFNYSNLQHDFKQDFIDLLNLINQKINIFLKNNFKLEDYVLLCDYLALIADYPNLNNFTDDGMKTFVNNLPHLWQLNYSDDISKATWYQRFTRIRTDVTLAILKQFNAKQLLQVTKSQQILGLFIEWLEIVSNRQFIDTPISLKSSSNNFLSVNIFFLNCDQKKKTKPILT